MSNNLLGIFLAVVSVVCVKGQGPGGAGAGAGAMAQLLALASQSGGRAGTGAVGSAGAAGGSEFSNLMPLAFATGGSSNLANMALLGGLLRGGSGEGGRGGMARNFMLINQYGLDNYLEYSLCNNMMGGRGGSVLGFNPLCMRYLL